MAFLNYHCHSEGSLLDGAGSPVQRAEQAKKLGQDSLGITDHGNLIMVPQHIEACKDVGIKPIVGVESYFKPDRNLKDDDNRKAWHTILLAKNETGWKNLIKIVSESHISGFYYKPCADWELLQKYGEGLIYTSSCISGYLPWLIKENDQQGINHYMQKACDIFGDDFYLEIQPHDIPEQRLANIKLSHLAYEWGVKLSAAADSHFPYEDWRDTQDIILMIATGQDRKNRQKKKDKGEDTYEMDAPLHMYSESEMYERFAINHPDLSKDIVVKAVKETANIRDKCEEIELDTSQKLPKVKDARNTLKEWCDEGMKRIGKEDDPVYKQRLEHEFKTLDNMGVIDYFIIVGRILRWARMQNIRINSGRGSAAGSLICYLIKITTIDPIAHDLLFERFLNENRKGLPDIDIDFERERRPEVKEKLAEEQGEDNVADIAALQTYGPKGALKDVARVLNVSFPEINTVSKVIPEAGDVGGAANVPPLSNLRQQYTVIDNFAIKYPEVWRHAIRLEGHVKGLSKHAAGVVVTPGPVTDYMPLMRGAKESDVDIITGWSDSANYPTISMLQILKIDILSLDGLSKQRHTTDMVKESTGENIDLDAMDITHDPNAIDPKVMELFQKGITLGIFQFGGSKGITRFLKHTKPDKFEDLIAVNALYRPGPLEGGDAFDFGDYKNGKKPITYWDEAVIPFLERTYGVMVYQEQLQQIAQELGGFTPSESDDLRKIASKIYRMGRVKAEEAMEPYKEQWMKGCLEHGLGEADAEDIWAKMLGFAQYSFNRSHSASYALAGYQDAWLKTYHPLEFYAALLSYENNPDEIMQEANAFNIQIKPPDINLSDGYFTVADDKLLFGLRKVKQVGVVTFEEIKSHRPYTSYQDFEDRITPAKCNKLVRENLVKGGAFDSFGMRDDWTDEQKREAEFDALEVAISGVGSAYKYEDILDPRINTEEEIEEFNEGEGVVVGGEFTKVKLHKIKSGNNKGKTMAYTTLTYKDNTFDCTFFKNKLEKYSDLVTEGMVVVLRGRKGGQQNEVLVDSGISIEELKTLIKKEENGL